MKGVFHWNMASYSVTDVSSHNTRGDCWIIIGSSVYNVTPFLEEHPGGDDILLEGGGKDVTDDFHDVGHSKAAEDQLEHYAIGELSDSSNNNQLKQSDSSNQQLQQSEPATTLLYIAVMIGVISTIIVSFSIRSV